MSNSEVMYTKEIYDSANYNNRELLNDYLIELKSKGRKSNTIREYTYDGRMIICYIKKEMNDKSLLECNKKDFRMISMWLLEDRKVSPARFNRIFSLIHGMMKYADDEDSYEMKKNYSKQVAKLKNKPTKEIVFLTDNQIEKLRNYLLDNKMHRECAFLDVCYDSAARINEVVQMNKIDLLENRYSNSVIGKRDKKFNIILNDRSVESIGLYLTERGSDGCDNLWIRKRSKVATPISAYTAYTWSKNMSKALSKLENRKIEFSAHNIRHSALENYSNGSHYMCRVLAEPRKFNLEELRVIAHHDNVGTTKGYLKPKDNAIIGDIFGMKIG